MMKPAALNSAMMRLTDECLVPQQPQKDMGKSWLRWDRNKRASICVCRKLLA